MSVHLSGNSDGGCRKKGQVGGYGAVLVNLQDGGKTTIHEFIGPATNNQAEYRGLIAALEVSIELGTDTLDMSLDSELVVLQIKEVYRVNEGLLPLYNKCKNLIRRIPGFVIQHVYRRFNEEADSLANLAMDRMIPGRVVEHISATQTPKVDEPGVAPKVQDGLHLE